jgi:hypothetical protein
MLTSKGKIALAGLAAVAAIAAVGSKKKDDDWPKPGETWHYVFSFYPDLPSKEAADQAEVMYREGMKDIARVDNFDVYSNKNTLDLTVTYIKRPPVNVAVGSEANFGPMTMVLTEKDKVSSGVSS